MGSIRLGDNLIGYANIVFEGLKSVIINLASSSQTTGTLSVADLTLLQGNDSNYIETVYDGHTEVYRLDTKASTDGYLIYNHQKDESNQIGLKSITLTIATRSWVLSDTSLVKTVIGKINYDNTYDELNVNGLKIGDNHDVTVQRDLFVEDEIIIDSSSKIVDTNGNAIFGSASTKNTGTSAGNIPILDNNGKLANSTIPAIAITDTFVVNSQEAMLALDAQVGDVAIRTDINKSFILQSSTPSILSNWKEILTPIGAVTSVNGQTGAVTISTNSIGAANDNTVVHLSGSEIITGNKNFTGTLTQNSRGVATYKDAIDTSGVVVEHIGSNPNLLINGDFRVNQRGQASYSGINAIKYTVDRWAINWSTPVSYDVTTKTLHFTGNGSFCQYIEDTDVLLGKTVTLSFKINGNVYSGSATLASSYSETAYPIVVNITGGGKVSLIYASSKSKFQVSISSDSGTTFDLVLDYVKLELGSVATPFSPRHYGEELALCQRYYQVLRINGVTFFKTTSGTIYIGIPLIKTMRNFETITFDPYPSARGNNQMITLTNASIHARYNNILQISSDVSSLGFTNGEVYVLVNGTAIVDAEIY